MMKFENIQRSIAALKKINIDRKNHNRRMKMIKQNEVYMLDAIDNAFANLK